MSKPPEPGTRETMRQKALEEPASHPSHYPHQPQKQRRIETREWLYEELFDQTVQLVGTLDLQGNLLTANRTALQLINTEEPEVLGRPLVDTPWWNHSPREQAKLRQAIRDAGAGQVCRFETRYRDAAGTAHVIDFSLKPVFDQGGQVAFLLAEGRDITSYERATRQLLQLKNLYLALSRVNEAILRIHQADELLQEICDIAAHLDDVRLAWFGFAEDDTDRRVVPRVWSGEAVTAIHQFHLEEVGQTLPEPTGRPGFLVIDDLEQDPDAGRWQDVLRSYSLRSLAAYPLQRREGPDGLFVLYSDRPGLFRGEIGELFEELSANVAHALDNLERERLRLAAEQALRDSEARYRELVENANTIILRLAPDGTITHFNEFAESFFGWPRAEIVGRPMWETIQAEGGDRASDLRVLFANLCRVPEDYRCHVNQNRCRDGRRVWVAWTNKVFCDSSGQVLEVLSIGVDITAQRQQELLLERRAREEEVRAELLRLSMEEPSLADFLQRALQQLVTSTWLEVLPCGAVFLVAPGGGELRLATSFNLPAGLELKCSRVPFGTCLCGQVALTGRPQFGMRCRNGHPGKAHSHHVLPLLSGEEPLGVLTLYVPDHQVPDPSRETFFQSVADLLASVIIRKQVQASLREHDALLQQLIDTIPLPIYHKDTELVYQGCNSAFASDILGLPKQAIIGKRVTDIAPDDLAAVYADSDRNLLRNGGSQNYETQVLYTDGQRHPVSIHKAVLRTPEGTPRGIVGVILDLSDRKQLEEQLRHAQKVEALGTLTGGIAHDFNNLLTAIMGYASILQIKMPRHELHSEMVTQILATTERAAKLTHSLLTYSRKKVAHPQLIEINRVVDGVKNLARRLIRESIELDIDLCDEPLVVQADAFQLEQVLINLVTNARDAMLQGGRLVISTRRVAVPEVQVRRHVSILPGEYALIAVTDSGIGIPDELLERIFDPFFTTKEIGRGTGLGLSISYSIVKQHQGFIDVETGLNQGTTFRIYLPLAEAPGEVDRQQEGLGLARGGSETLLLVEDDPAVRIASKLLLEEFGYRVVEARDGTEALDILDRRAGEIDLVLSDVVMPRLGGMELRGEILRRWPRLPLLFTSGYTFDTLEDHGANEEVEVLEKPVKPAEMLQRIRDLLDRTGPG